MWLYRAIFEFKLINGSKYHICKDFRFMMNDKHIWKFDDHRLQELKRENDDPANGLTEQTIRYCYELFARTRIVPYFKHILPNGVCASDHEFVLRENTRSKSEGNMMYDVIFFDSKLGVYGEIDLLSCYIFASIIEITFSNHLILNVHWTILDVYFLA